MMIQLSRIVTALKALRQLGPTQVGLNLLYKFGLASGHYRRASRPPAKVDGLLLRPVMPLPVKHDLLEALGESGLKALLAEADEIVNGSHRMFGAEPVVLQLTPPGPLAHWSDYENGKIREQGDVKFTWEPARFGWAFILGRAYHASKSEKYAQAFWRFFEVFSMANPPYNGPNWTSGQEVGLRLIAYVWAAQTFAGSSESSGARLSALANATAAHAARIPVTLVYARSQNNNHLLTEAAALLSAGLALPEHPKADGWVRTGRKWLRWCFAHQIDTQGEYIQHSSNYQRLMLQTALWVHALDQQAVGSGKTVSMPGKAQPACLDEMSRKHLALAARWLANLLDPTSGRVPNLGANDGALILPFSTAAFCDYRPIVQTALLAFQTEDLPAASLDEMLLWFGLAPTGNTAAAAPHSQGILTAPNSWSYLRAVKTTSRPSHADQLHLDLWWRGLNIAQDAGTYLYNAGAPWDNALTSTLVHNTVSVDGREQMTRASRFLYLDWADAEYLPPRAGSPDQIGRIGAQTDAYARMQISHERQVTVFKDEHWLVEDHLANQGTSVHVHRLHWLLPDWEWQLSQEDAQVNIRLYSPLGWVALVVMASQPIKRVGIIRAGELVHGDGLVSAVFGWVSPTYSLKTPAISLAVEVQSEQHVLFKSEFVFPENTHAA